MRRSRWRGWASASWRWSYAARARARAEALGHPGDRVDRDGGGRGAVRRRRCALDALGRFAASPQQAPRDEWRTLLFQAFAASRAGDARAASFAAQAHAAAEALGHPDLPARHEPDIAAALGAASGPPALEVTLLGGFARDRRRARARAAAGARRDAGQAARAGRRAADAARRRSRCCGPARTARRGGGGCATC